MSGQFRRLGDAVVERPAQLSGFVPVAHRGGGELSKQATDRPHLVAAIDGQSSQGLGIGRVNILGQPPN